MEPVDYSEYQMSAIEKVILLISLAVLLTAIGILFYNTPVAAAATPFLFIPASAVYSDEMAERRRIRLRNQFRDLLDSLASSFAGGRHMREAIEEAGNELSSIYEPDDEIMIEIKNMIKRMDDGETDRDVISDLAVRSGIEDVEMFARVFAACRETGGNMIHAMSDASSMLADKIKIENEIRAQTAQKKAEGLIISVMPVMIILFLRAVAPDYINVLYGNLTGAALMTLALGAVVYAYYLIRKITEIEI